MGNRISDVKQAIEEVEDSKTLSKHSHSNPNCHCDPCECNPCECGNGTQRNDNDKINDQPKEVEGCHCNPCLCNPCLNPGCKCGKECVSNQYQPIVTAESRCPLCFSNPCQCQLSTSESSNTVKDQNPKTEVTIETECKCESCHCSPCKCISDKEQDHSNTIVTKGCDQKNPDCPCVPCECNPCNCGKEQSHKVDAKSEDPTHELRDDSREVIEEDRNQMPNCNCTSCDCDPCKCLPSQ